MNYDRAAEWLLKIRSAEPSLEELKEWNEWLRTKENQRAFDAVARTWQSSEGVDEPVLRSKRRVPIYAAAAALAVLGLASILWLRGNYSSTPGLTGRSVLQETATGQHRRVSLADGSMVFLGARTAISVHYAPDARTIVLDRGEALFDVKRDAARPFVVVAGAGTITAVGTAFDVKRGETGVVVTVTEGKVKIERPGAGVVAQLSHGEQLAYGSAGVVGAVRHADLEAAMAWREGRLLYRSEPLKRVVEDVNRYSRRQIVLGNSAAGELLFSGTVQEHQIDDWLRGLTDIFPVEVAKEREDRVVLRVRGQ